MLLSFVFCFHTILQMKKLNVLQIARNGEKVGWKSFFGIFTPPPPNRGPAHGCISLKAVWLYRAPVLPAYYLVIGWLRAFSLAAILNQVRVTQSFVPLCPPHRPKWGVKTIGYNRKEKKSVSNCLKWLENLWTKKCNKFPKSLEKNFW